MKQTYHMVRIQAGWPMYDGNVRCYCKGGAKRHRKLVTKPKGKKNNERK